MKPLFITASLATARFATDKDNVSGTVQAVKPKIVIHTNKESDKKILLDHFNPDVLGRPIYLSGLDATTEMTLKQAITKGIRVITTWLPIDKLAKLGAVTVMRVSNYSNPDTGITNTRVEAPVDYFTAVIPQTDVARAAFAALKETAEFKKAFASTNPADALNLDDDDEDPI